MYFFVADSLSLSDGIRSLSIFCSVFSGKWSLYGHFIVRWFCRHQRHWIPSIWFTALTSVSSSWNNHITESLRKINSNNAVRCTIENSSLPHHPLWLLTDWHRVDHMQHHQIFSISNQEKEQLIWETEDIEQHTFRSATIGKTGHFRCSNVLMV